MAEEEERQNEVEQPEQEQGQEAGASESMPTTYLWQSIVVTLLCCLPLGIPAIVFASQTNTNIAAGNMAEARKTSDKARMWCWIAFVAGLAVIVISVILQIALGGFAAAAAAAG